MRELELQKHLKELFAAMEPSYLIEVTQGPKELGKDLVLIKEDHLTTDVIGVVVKCGDIKGKTLGEVDEVAKRVNYMFNATTTRQIETIESQMRQAIAHPAEVKDNFKPYKVNKVLVVVAGEISSEARTRLEREVIGGVEGIHGIMWLVDNFTDFYPEVFFEGKVTTFLQDKIKELEGKHLASKSHKMLSDCFVEPVVQTTDISIDLKETLENIWKRKKLPFSQLKSIVSKHKPVILIGDPGTGKSAALAKLTIDLMKEAYKSTVTRKNKTAKTSMPILLTARQILDTENETDLLKNYFNESEVSSQVSIKVLFIDGLDEINSENRAEVIKKSNAFAKSFNSGLVIASRKIDIFRITPLGFEKLELLPFGAGQALSLIEKLNTTPAVFEVLKEGLERIKNQIPMVPLSLLLLIDLVEEHKEVPASVTELYDRYNDSVLGRDDKDKGIEVLFEYMIKKRYLASLAFNEFLEKDLVEITRANFDKFNKMYAAEYGMDDEILQKFITDIERAGALQVADETVLFRHRSFQDYFAGYFIYDRRDEIDNADKYIVNKYFEDDAGQTTFFYVGLKRAITQKLLTQIFDYEDDSLLAELNKVMAGNLLQAGWNSTTGTKQYGIDNILSYINKSRKRLQELANSEKWTQPKVMANLFVIIVGEISLRSGFLIKELENHYSKLGDNDDVNDLFTNLALLWIIKPFLDAENLSSKVENLLARITDSKTLSNEDRVQFTLIISIIDQRDKVMTKSIRRNIDKVFEQFPRE